MKLTKSLLISIIIFFVISPSMSYVGEGTITAEDPLNIETINPEPVSCQDPHLPGELTSTGLTNQADVWFEWDSDLPQLMGRTSKETRSEGQFAHEISGELEEGTEYYVRAHANNSANEDTGDLESFECEEQPPRPEDCIGNSAFSGCVNPVQFDPHPYDFRDTVSTFASFGQPENPIAATLFGSVIYRQEGERVRYSEGSGSEVDQPYLDTENEEYPWAAGIVLGVDVDYGDEGTTYEEGRNYPSNPDGEIAGVEHVQYPGLDHATYDEGYVDSPEDYCGNAMHSAEIEGQTGGPEFNCPDDYGLADNIEGGTESDSVQTISDSHSDMSPQDMGEEFDVINPGSDSLHYVMDLYGEEISGHEYIWLRGSTTSYEEGDLDSDVESASEVDETGTEIEFDIIEYGNMPDFYRESDKSVGAVYLTDSLESKGSVQAYYLIEQDHDSVDDYTEADGSCTQQSGTDSWSCGSSSSETVCTDRERVYPEYELTSDSEYQGSDSTYRYETEKSFPGWTEDRTEQNTFETTVNYYDGVEERGTSGDYYYRCNNWNTYDDDSCSGGYNCTIDSSDGGSGYQTTTNAESLYSDYDSKSIEVGFWTLDYEEETAFHVDDAQNEYGDNPIDALFSGDPYHYRTNQNDGSGGHFGVDVNSEPQPNNPSVSSSEFQIRIGNSEGNLDSGGEHFISERVWWGTANIDGEFGQANGYIAYASSPGDTGYQGSNELFADEEVAEGQFSENIITKEEAGEQGNCGIYYCFNHIYLGLNNLAQWEDPTDPSTGVEYDVETIGVDESYSACRQYQELDEEGPEGTALRCQFDHAAQFPGGPTPARERPLYPDDFN